VTGHKLNGRTWDNLNMLAIFGLSLGPVATALGSDAAMRAGYTISCARPFRMISFSRSHEV
jgi:hypothetical protein